MLFWFLISALFISAAFAQPPLRIKTWMGNAARRRPIHEEPQKRRTLGHSHLLIQFGDVPSADTLNQLQGRGVAVLSYIPDFAYSVSANDDAHFDGMGIQWMGRLQPDEKISPDLIGPLALGSPVPMIIELYSDVDPNEGRAIVSEVGATIRENPDLLASHLMVEANANRALELARWDEVAYIFPASNQLAQGIPSQGYAGALTSQGAVTQSVPLIGDGWDGPGQGAANLTYSFVRLPEKLPSESAKQQIEKAYSEWAKYAKLTFTETTNSTGRQTLAVLFASKSHGDPYPFDGPGGIVAHTFYPYPVNQEPIAGDMHFDDDENWNIGADLDLFSIALHETGHALGLGHSDNPADVMYPYYRKVTGLSPNDIAAVLELYAPQVSIVPVPTLSSPLTLTFQAPATSTSASSISLTGATSGGSGTVQVSWSTSQGLSGTAQGSTVWTASSIPLIIGSNEITITARDTQQNQVSRSVTVTSQPPPSIIPTTPASGPDTTPPSLTILSPSTSTISTSASSLMITGTATDNVGVTAVTWSSSTGASGKATGFTAWSISAIPLYVGTSTITIRASDAAGNIAWRSVTVTRR